MTNEVDGAIMFNIKIIPEFRIHKQRGTILTWTFNDIEDDFDDDTAISFQEKEGGTEIW